MCGVFRRRVLGRLAASFVADSHALHMRKYGVCPETHTDTYNHPADPPFPLPKNNNCKLTYLKSSTKLPRFRQSCPPWYVCVVLCLYI